MAYSTQKPKISQPLVAAFLAFGLFIVAYQFYDSPKPEPIIATPAPSAVSTLLRPGPKAEWDFSAFDFEFTSDPESINPPFDVARFQSQSITRQQLTAVLIGLSTRQASNAASARNTFQQHFDSIMSVQSTTTDPIALKQISADLLSSFSTNPQTPNYHAQNHSITALIRSGAWQSSTGTLVYELVTLRQLPSLDDWQTRVQIFERGHVLPGFMRWKDDAWQLYGLEMTVLGQGLKAYGPVPALPDQGLAIRIVSAPEALVWQAIAPFTRNADAVAIAILRDTAQRFDIPLRQLEENIKQQIQRQQADPAHPLLKQTRIRAPWAFGTCFVPDGEFQLIKRDRIPAVDTLLPYPEILAARSVNRRPRTTETEDPPPSSPPTTLPSPRR